MKRPSLVWLLAATAVIEAITGISLIAIPSTDGWLLFHQSLSGAGLAAGRIAGVALLALGVAGWVGRYAQGRSAVLAAMLTYNTLAALYLAYLAINGELVGLLLWPAVALHAGLGLLLAHAWLRPRHDGE